MAEGQFQYLLSVLIRDIRVQLSALLCSLFSQSSCKAESGPKDEERHGEEKEEKPNGREESERSG